MDHPVTCVTLSYFFADSCIQGRIESEGTYQQLKNQASFASILAKKGIPDADKLLSAGGRRRSSFSLPDTGQPMKQRLSQRRRSSVALIQSIRTLIDRGRASDHTSEDTGAKARKLSLSVQRKSSVVSLHSLPEAELDDILQVLKKQFLYIHVST